MGRCGRLDAGARGSMSAIYFAWVNAGEAFGPTHERVDEDVFEVEIGQAEGEHAYAKVSIRNPRSGLLAAGRKQWAWIAYDSGETDGVTPLLKGRLVGIPDDMQAEVVTLTFDATPGNFNTAKAALADSMRIAPYYDPI